MPIKMEPRTFMGQPLGDPEISDRGDLPRGWLKNVADDFSFNSYMTAERWRMLNEDEPGLLPEEWDEKVEDREMPFEPNTTMSGLERRIAHHDFNEYSSKYESHISAALVGGAPLIFDPVNVALLPLGGPAGGFAKAAASGWGGFLARYALGGATAGIASVPLEIGFQRAETGRLRPFEIAGTVAGPALLAPALGAVGRGIRNVFRGPDPAPYTLPSDVNGPAASRIMMSAVTGKDLDPAQGFRIVQQAMKDGVPPPPIAQRLAKPAPPQARLRALFGDYEGGHREWFRDFAAGSMKAIRKLESLGYDRNDPMLRRLVKFVGRHSDQRSKTPVKYNTKVLDAFDRHQNPMKGLEARGLSEEQISILRENGLITEEVVSKSTMRVGKQQQSTVRYDLTPLGRQLRELLEAPANEANSRLIQKVRAEGLGALRRAVDLETDTSPPPRVIDDDWDDLDLLSALGVMRRSNAAPTDMPPPRRAKSETDEGTIEGRTDVDDDMDAWASSVGAADRVQVIDDAVIDGARRAKLCGTR